MQNMNKKDMKTLANKVIVITGASSGIGEAMAKAILSGTPEIAKKSIHLHYSTTL